MKQGNQLLEKVSAVQWNAAAIGAEISILTEESLNALADGDRPRLEALLPLVRHSYDYLSALNDGRAEETSVFAHGRLATLLECLDLAMTRAEPSAWKAHFRDAVDLRILRFVAGEWQRVSDIAEAIGRHNSSATKRLQKLASEELLVPQPIGREVYYRLSSAARDALSKRGLIDRLEIEEANRPDPPEGLGPYYDTAAKVA